MPTIWIFYAENWTFHTVHFPDTSICQLERWFFIFGGNNAPIRNHVNNIMRLFLTSIAVLISMHSFGQSVPSICEPTEEVLDLYYQDAQLLALRRIYAEELTYIDSIEISHPHTDSALYALTAVFNALDLPARDTVVDLLNIHTFPVPITTSLVLAVDPASDWVAILSDGVTPTGNDIVDSLMVLYDLSFSLFFDYSSFLDYNVIVLSSEAPWNMVALGAAFETIPGVVFSEMDGIAGDGNDITDTIFSDHVEITYNYGWGDCMAGCSSRRYWKFSVYDDCSVAFDGSYGDVLDILSTNEMVPEPIKIFPNPFVDRLVIDTHNFREPYWITDLSGRLIHGGVTNGGMIDGLDFLKPGVYLLRVKSDGLFRSAKIVKQ